MRYLPLLLAMTIASTNLPGQFSEDFKDGEITSNPVWYGDVNDFIVNSDLALQLNAAGAGQSVLYTRTQFPDSIRWEMDLELQFSPSNANRLRILLMADTIVNGIPFNGYYLEIGEDGPDDGISFFSADGGVSEFLAASPGIESDGIIDVSVGVRRSIEGHWQVFWNHNGYLFSILELTDTTFSPDKGRIFGMLCTYTSSRKDKFIFDNIALSVLVHDTVPPVMQMLSISSDSSLQVQFNEPISIEFTEIEIIPGDVSVATLQATGRMLDISFNKSFTDATEYEARIAQVGDTAGNISSTYIESFTYYKTVLPGPTDILINELMADPLPSVGMPEHEFIELFNSSPHRILTSNITLQIGGSAMEIPPVVFNPGDYLVLCPPGSLEEFSRYGIAMEIADWVTLPNSGTGIMITDAAGAMIDYMTYDQNTYHHPERDDGGWSLERVSHYHPCQLEYNWSASSNAAGGTPGTRNSQPQVTDTDIYPPRHLYILYDDQEWMITLVFDEILDQNSAVQYHVTPADLHFTHQTHINTIILTLDEPLDAGRQYAIKMQLVADCTGNTAGDIELNLQAPADLAYGDIRLNEILFDPLPGNSTFIEITNSSTEYLLLSDLLLLSEVNGSIKPGKSQQKLIIPPGRIVALTSNPYSILVTYSPVHPDWVVPFNVPPLSSTSGTVVLRGLNGNLLDSMNYNSDMHHPLLSNPEGVSLERIDPDIPSADTDNWHSASSTVGYGTPSGPNSQNISQKTGDGYYHLENASFSPDNDGHADYMALTFANIPPGYTGTAAIFDLEGRFISWLLQNEILGSSSMATWDGKTTDGSMSGTGIYILMVEMISDSGHVIRRKEPVILVATF